MATAASALYLLNLPFDTIWWTGGVLLLVGIVAGAFLFSWVYPSLEVAPAGQTHVWRILKAVGPVVVALIVGGLAKLLY